MKWLVAPGKKAISVVEVCFTNVKNAGMSVATKEVMGNARIKVSSQVSA